MWVIFLLFPIIVLDVWISIILSNRICECGLLLWQMSHLTLYTDFTLKWLKSTTFRSTVEMCGITSRNYIIFYNNLWFANWNHFMAPENRKIICLYATDFDSPNKPRCVPTVWLREFADSGFIRHWSFYIGMIYLTVPEMTSEQGFYNRRTSI